jgi:hypothetical protein
VLADVRSEIVSFGSGGQNIRGGIEEVLAPTDPWLEDDREH